MRAHTRRAVVAATVALPAVAALPAPTALPEAWAEIERSALWLAPAYPAEVRATIAHAMAAGLDPAAVTFLGVGTPVRPAPFTLYFGDLTEGSYAIAHAEGVWRAHRQADGFIRGGPAGREDEGTS
jgi:hypothetical protein